MKSKIGEARREFLLHRFSRKFERSLGYALHYIQDLFTIAVDDHRLHGRSLSDHNEIEAKFPKYTVEIAYEGFNPILLEGEDEVFSFVRESIECIPSRRYALSHPRETLERCFKTCLSVAHAVCNNEKGFSKGAEAIEVSDGIKQSMKRIGGRLDEMKETVAETVRQTQEHIGRLKAMQEENQQAVQSSIEKIVYLDAPLRSDLDKLCKSEPWENELLKDISKLNEIIESGYERDYENAQAHFRGKQFDN